MATNNALNKTSDTFTTTTSYSTTFDTNVAAAGVTLAGTTLSADGTDANIDININPKATGLVSVTNGTANGAYLKTLVTGFGGLLSAADTNVQLALDTLDNVYESGTWTPVLSFGGGTTGITYSVQDGFYKLYKDVAHIWCDILLSSKGTDTGVALISGLPYACGNNAGKRGVGVIRPSSLDFNSTYAYAYINQNATTIPLYKAVNAAGGGQLTDAEFANSTLIHFSFSYITT